MATEQKTQCWCEGLGEELSRMASKLGPSEEVQGHFRAARIEFLKGLRSLIDEKIERANRAQTASKGASITVE
jgi:hypothetical protein